LTTIKYFFASFLFGIWLSASVNAVLGSEKFDDDVMTYSELLRKAQPLDYYYFPLNLSALISLAVIV